MNREAVETEPDEIGVDVARFGNDKTEMYRRKGAKTIAHESYAKKDTVFIANAAWDMAGRSRDVVIKVDVGGLGAGVVDKLRELGANVIEINFGGSPKDKNKYTSCADEMWFSFSELLNEIEIPNDSQLMEELSGRKFTYDKIGRRKVEPKDDFKKRYGRSPDKADALLMAFYSGYHRGGSTIGSARLAGV
jgi:phage terminase large subunit